MVFFYGLLKAMGFSFKWVKLIMDCVSTVSYSLMINGRQCGSFTPDRGLRQGDHLSPFFHFMCKGFLFVVN